MAEGRATDCGGPSPSSRRFLRPALGDPNSPVCRQDEKLFVGCGVHPTADSTSARKCESVFAVAVDNGELHIAIERDGIYWLPVHNKTIHLKPTRGSHLKQPRKQQIQTTRWRFGIEIDQTGLRLPGAAVFIGSVVSGRISRSGFSISSHYARFLKSRRARSRSTPQHRG
jgi:hypothetical protein